MTADPAVANAAGYNLHVTITGWTGTQHSMPNAKSQKKAVFALQLGRSNPAYELWARVLTLLMSCLGAADSAGSFLEEPAASACGLSLGVAPCPDCLPAKACKQHANHGCMTELTSCKGMDACCLSLYELPCDCLPAKDCKQHANCDAWATCQLKQEACLLPA